MRTTRETAVKAQKIAVSGRRDLRRAKILAVPYKFKKKHSALLFDRNLCHRRRRTRYLLLPSTPTAAPTRVFLILARPLAALLAAARVLGPCAEPALRSPPPAAFARRPFPGVVSAHRPYHLRLQEAREEVARGWVDQRRGASQYPSVAQCGTLGLKKSTPPSSNLTRVRSVGK